MADRRVLLAVLTALAALATAGSALVADGAPPPPASMTVTESDVLSCPVVAGEPTLWATAPGETVGVRTAEVATIVDAPLRRDAPAEVFSLVPSSGQPAGAVSATAGKAASWGTCAPPLTDQSLVLADSRGTDILLVNADATDAVVNVTLRGEGGPLDAGGTRGLLVPARRSLAVPLSVLSPAGEAVAAEIQTTTGRVLAFGRRAGTTGVDVASSSPAATGHLLGAVPAGVDDVDLLVSNPGESRATLTVSALAPSGSFTPAGAEQLTVAPGTVIRVDLSAAASDTEPVAIAVTSDEPVSASLNVATEADFANVGSWTPLTNGQVFVPGGRLVLANPSDSDATVTLEADAVTGAGVPEAKQVVKAGAAWSVALPNRPVRVTVTSAVPVGAWVVLPTGVAIAPLQPVAVTSSPVTLERDPLLR